MFGRRPIFVAAIDSDPDMSQAEKLGCAVQWALTEKQSLNGACLNGANLSGLNLENQDLSGATLTGATLNGANLRNANLSGAFMKGARICNARLDHANFDGADLNGADLIDTNCEATLFDNAILHCTNFQGANVLRASFTCAKLGRDMLTYPQWCSASLGAIEQNALLQFSRVPELLDNWEEAVRLGHSRTIDLHTEADSSSPWEVFFHSVWIGDTPDSHPTAKVALDWIQKAIRIRDA